MSELHHAQLHVTGATIERGARTLLHDVTLTLAPGDRVGLLGPNGAGKSSLLLALAGRLALAAGTVTTVPSGATVGLLSQELDAERNETVVDYIARKTGVAEASDALDVATAALSEGNNEAIDAHHHALERWMALGAADFDQRLRPTLEAVGIAPDRSLEQRASTLSGGEQAKCGLGALLLSRHDILLLDEPTNNLDQRGLALLESYVVQRPGPVMVVSHDRRFLEAVTNAVVELDPHGQQARRYEESFSQYLEAREVAARHARRRYDDYVGDRGRLEERATMQRQWATKGVKAERTPPDNDRAARGFRIDKTEKLAAKARQSERALERLEVVDKPWEPWELQFTIGTADRAGNLVAALDQAVIDRGGFTLGPVSVTIAAGERVAIVGENGAGKTTMVQALLGLAPLDSGQNRVGPGTRLGWLGQNRLTLGTDRPAGGGDSGGAGEQRTALELAIGATGLVTSEARSLLAKFGLAATHVTRPLEELSPGERTRLVLATFQAAGINTLVLDEPTNHLDLEAISQLEQALGHYAGTLLLVTHDRAFCESTALTRRLRLVDGQLVADDVL